VVPVGTIATLNCATATHNGSLIAGVSASSVNSLVPYSGGNGGSYNGRSVASTGVSGLTATVLGGNFANGSGNLNVAISGTPNAIGTANFALSIGGKTCTFSRIVLAGSIASLNCSAASHFGTLTQNQAASNVRSVVQYEGGNGGLHSGQIVSSGVRGLTATLLSGKFGVGGQQLTYTISGTPTSFGVASFPLNIGGKSCVLTRTIYKVGSVSSLGCSSPTHSGTLISGLLSSGGVSSTITYFGGNGGTYNGQTVASSGVLGLTATLIPGIFSNGLGLLTYYISGTPSSSGAAIFTLNIGGKSCTVSRTVLPGSITGLSCSSASHSGTLTQGLEAGGVTSSVPYTGGNGGSYNVQSVQSMGVDGLTATLVAGKFLAGSGSLMFTITGTPTGSGTASFVIAIGGQNCTLYRSVASDGSGSPATCGATNVHNPSKTYGTVMDIDGNIYKTVVIGSTRWMAENLKTSRYQNGDPIPNIINNAEWAATAELPYGSARGTGAWCHMNNNPANECPYGKLYNFFAVRDPRGLCPAGWVVPAAGDIFPFIDNMVTSLGGSSVAGGKLKSTGNFYWAAPNTGATNSSGFSGLPGGLRISCCDVTWNFEGFSDKGAWWSSALSESGSEAYSIEMSSTSSGTSIHNYYKNRSGLSVRCAKSTSARIGFSNPTLSATLYPNPAQNKFTLELTGEEPATSTIQVTDLQGRVVLEEKRNLTQGSNTLTFDISSLTSGMYLVYFSNDESKSLVKLIKE
jgi:uncharacterized protein (TIGR02145 family)